MRFLILPLIVAIGCSAAKQPQPMAAKPNKPADAVSNLHHPISTNASAQRFFDDGLSQIYAFNHAEAIKQFKKAADADPNLGMAHWGIALALGPNYNIDVDPQREKEAATEMQKATTLALNAPQVEKDYIAALSKRFSGAEKPDLKKFGDDYAAAMQALMNKYPDDLDAATLYADAMMCLRPWQLYALDGTPAAGTDKIVAALESVLKRDPDHVGANHLYIHAVEASKHPERALEAAARLPLLAPSCGHLVHMPSHVYARVGDQESAATSNEAAVNVDRDYFTAHPDMTMGPYNMMYYSHNMHFLAYAEMECGSYANAKKWAMNLSEHAKPGLAQMPMLEVFLTVQYGVEARCHQWDDILKEPSPDAKSQPLTTITWHFARGMASARKGDPATANSERATMVGLIHALPPDAGFGPLNSAKDVFAVAIETLDGEIEAAQKNYTGAAKFYADAAELQDKLNYSEPPEWLLNSRELWGSTLLKTGDFATAEKVFREDLNRHPRGGRSLKGLQTALEKQGKTYEASLVQRQQETAWKDADIKLQADDL